MTRDRLVMIALTWLLLAGSGSPVTAATPVAATAQEAALVGARVDDLAPLLADDLDRVTIAVTLDPAASTVGGSISWTITNRTGADLAELPFRLYPNADYYLEGATTISAATVDGQPAPVTRSVADTVATVTLPAPLPPDGVVTIAFDFVTVIPTDSTGSYGLFQHDTLAGSWVIADWYPILAGWEPDRGWVLDQPTPAGDPTFSAAATYDVTLDAPADLTVIATGIATSGGGGEPWRIVTGPAREFSFVAMTSPAHASLAAGETTINLWLDPTDPTPPDQQQALLEIAAEALTTYGSRYGAYPYRDLDLIEVDLDGAWGISWAGLLFINPQAVASVDPNVRDFTIWHEVGHQWWGNVVGANSNDHAFMVEGLTNYLASVGVADAQGPEAGASLLLAQVAGPYESALLTYPDGIADLPVTVDTGGMPRGALIYGKAALGFMALREAIGDEAFFAALDAYATECGFGIGTPETLRTIFGRYGGADVVDPVWSLWFDQAVTTPADVETLLAAP